MSGDIVAAPSWRWGLWSPNDRKWHDAVQTRWLGTVDVPVSPSPTIPLRIHQIWLGKYTIPPVCSEMMDMWKTMHPLWEYRLWTDRDVEDVFCGSSLREAFMEAGNPAQKSDIMRLEILRKFGGLYVDVDFECLKPFDHLHYVYSFFCGVSNVQAFELNNGLVAACPSHPLTEFVCSKVSCPWVEWGAEDVEPAQRVAHLLAKSAFCEVPTMDEGKGFFLATTGPGFFTRAVMRGLDETRHSSELESPVGIFPAEFFYPLSNALRDLPSAEKALEARPSSMAMHHWCRTWWADEEPATPL